MNQFIDNTFITDINNNVIKAQFPKLNNSEQLFVLKYFILLIDHISIKFNFNLKKKDTYIHQFKQNNYRDLKGLLLLLFPFINETRKSMREIKSLNDIYVQKQAETDKYEYSNLQYGRCNYDGKEYQEITFSRKHFKHNFSLLRATINRVANKLYVNWVHIRPIPVSDSYEDNQIYIETYNATKNKTFKIEKLDENLDYKGISVGDIYELITHKLYYEIKEIKWLIFDTKIINKEIIANHALLSRILPLQTILDNKKYNQLTIDQQKLFDTKWHNFLSETDSNKMDINKKMLAKMISYYFDKFNKNLNTKYKSLSENNLQKIEKELDKDETLSRTDKHDAILFNTLKSIKSEDAYNFLFMCIQQFGKTWYGRSLKNAHKNHDEGHYLLTHINLGQRHTDAGFVCVTLKNVYNYAKLFCSIIENNKLNPLPKFWEMLIKPYQKHILNMLNWKGPYGQPFWFNININIGYMYDTKDITKINKITWHIYDIINQQLASILMDIMTTEGILSELVFQKELSDDILLPKDENEKMTEIRKRLKTLVMDPEITKWKNCNYYLTGEPYISQIIRYNQYEKGVDKYTEMTYLDALCSDFGDMGSWYSTYAMDWVSQIGFFHKYINNRVIYVTGSTGVGKSTQIPKLLLYALHMVSYKPNGKIICSQPRVAPTTDNADTISKQLGVPIKEYNHDYKKYIVSNNYYVQFKHKKDSHTIDQSQLTLKIVTDGTLYEFIKQYPILKSYDDKKNYTTNMKNVCDIVIVDEAHEHNKNMDLILTFMKYTTYYNNDIRLVIISATMDDDEPTYRRYYRDINDNRLFPLNLTLQKYQLDRINVDRRLHISPPNTTTRFTIKEIYEPNKTPEEIVMHIINTTTEGDILLFKPGLAEIKASRNYLNNVLPSNCIALPFYGELNASKAHLIKKLDNEKKEKLQVLRSIPYELYNENMGTVPQGTYTRVIIIATNVAEASITIGTLRYVVDTGSEKAEIYDYKLNQTVTLEGPIAESSRLQRKGRIGRVAPGTAYYNYKEGAMANNKKKFGIATQNIADTLFDLLRVNLNKLFSANPNDPNIQDINIFNNMDNGLSNFIKAQYYIEDSFYNYFGKMSHYQYYNHNAPFPYYKDGFDKNTLEDSKGMFYIVHPNEIDFDRDIGGNIIKKLNDNIELEKNIIHSYKINQFWTFMQQKLFLYPTQNNDLLKTQFGKYIQSIRADLIDFTLDEVISLVYAKKYDILMPIVMIYSMLKVTMYKISSLTTPNATKFQKLFTSTKGDAINIYNICITILNYINTFNVLDMHNYKNEISLSKEKYLEGNLKDIPLNIFEKLKKLDYSNTLTNNSTLSNNELTMLLFDSNSHSINIAKYENTIKKWCNNMLLNYDVVKKFIDYNFNLSNKIEKYLKLNTFSYSTLYEEPSENIYDKINNVFISAYANNILKKINGTNKFTPILHPSLDTIYTIPFTRNKILNYQYYETLFNTKYSNYVLYLNINVIGKMVSIIIPITNLNILHKIHPLIYSLDNFIEPTSYFNGLIPNNIYSNNIVANFKSTVNSIKADLITIQKNENYIFYLNFEKNPLFTSYVKSQRLKKIDIINK